jgi:hypothetical protein
MTGASAAVGVDDDVGVDVAVVVVVVGEEEPPPLGALGRPFPCACARPGMASPTVTSKAIAEGRARCFTVVSSYLATELVDVLLPEVDPLVVPEPLVVPDPDVVPVPVEPVPVVEPLPVVPEPVVPLPEVVPLPDVEPVPVPDVEPVPVVLLPDVEPVSVPVGAGASAGAFRTCFAA